MSASRVYAVVLRQLYLLLESPARVLPLFAWAAVDIVLWGFLTRYLNQVVAPGSVPNFVPTLLGAVLLWDFFGRIMHGITTAFMEDVWAHNFLNIFASPLTVGEYLTGLILTSMATSLVGLVVMLALATTAFGLSFFAYGLLMIPFLLLLFLFGIAMGVLASAIVLRLGPAAEWLMWPIPSLLSPFAGVFYPLAILPGWMQLIGLTLPPAYVFEGMRAIVLGQPLPPNALLLAGGLDLLYLAAAAWVFQKVYRQAVVSGHLARYSAEAS